jgi:hypothetical protein
MDGVGVSSWDEMLSGSEASIVSSLFVTMILVGAHQYTGHLRSILFINKAMTVVIAALRATMPIYSQPISFCVAAMRAVAPEGIAGRRKLRNKIKSYKVRGKLTYHQVGAQCRSIAWLQEQQPWRESQPANVSFQSWVTIGKGL